MAERDAGGGESSGDAAIEFIQPAHFAKARGFSNGVVARGRTLYVAGQVGWELDGHFASDELAPQFARALDHVLDVVRAAGGSATNVVKMTVYVTDLPAYRASLAAIGEAWRARMGRHFPAMALVGVSGLVEPRAKVEIEATAALPDEPASKELAQPEHQIRTEAPR